MKIDQITALQLKTQRGLIRSFKRSDLPAVMAYRNDLEWMRYQGFKNLTISEYAEGLLNHHSVTEGKQYAFVERQSGQLLGDYYLEVTDQVCWLGYTVAPQFARQGYAYEGARVLIDFLQQAGVTVVQADVDPLNQASIGLLKKLHFRLKQTTDDKLIYQRLLR